MDYLQTGQARAGLANPSQAYQDKPETDGEIMKMERAIKSLYELRSRLSGVNIALRGNRPSAGEGQSAKNAPIERSLVSLITDLNVLAEQCHVELNETQELLR